NSLFNKMLSYFKETSDRRLKFEVGATSNENWGETSGSSDNLFTVTISTDIAQNGSNLARMVTLLHEITHAYMFSSLNETGVITFDSDGAPIINIGVLCDGENYSDIDINFELTLAERFEALIC